MRRNVRGAERLLSDVRRSAPDRAQIMRRELDCNCADVLV
jgi:hypothetical protein